MKTGKVSFISLFLIGSLGLCSGSAALIVCTRYKPDATGILYMVIIVLASYRIIDYAVHIDIKALFLDILRDTLKKFFPPRDKNK